ncbi:mannose-6-phosphate isomerase, class I [Corynebacterium bovis]|uniref:mannose-6-phosphate isomerase, class I n=1 Tax=Corynebacterium bovis TaxID=36808 RepID=UPI002549D3FA|nr:mannose-6-phosphate isomerase, class I [Corynebacterium bovis]MDK8511168.1 mannose-6-phosphate isomerase, class I [Corynebacterium bovis]
MTILHVEGCIRPYAWGSRTAIAELTGRPSPTSHPEAEMWFGAHPGGPCPVHPVGDDDPTPATGDPGEGTGAAPAATEGSPVAGGDARTLESVIAADVPGQLGDAAGPDGRLPFLLKLLAADQPLSLQAHPSREQAVAGFAREDAAGVPRDAFTRNYRDDNHKPELIVALTPFDAMAGFRPVGETLRLFDVVDCPELSRFRAMLGSGADADDLRGLLTTWITLPDATVRPLVAAVAASCRRAAARVADGAEPWMVRTLETVAELGDRYPGDSGVLCALLLNHVRLEPGEAIYLDAGQLHAYVRGFGVEVMANSDNVLRGGLTTKHVDVPELMHVLTFDPLEDPVRRPDAAGRYPVPVGEFALRRVTAADPEPTSVTGPAMLLGTAGRVQVDETAVPAGTDATSTALTPGDAVWVPARTTVGLTVLDAGHPPAGADAGSEAGADAGSGDHAVAFIVTVGTED